LVQESGPQKATLAEQAVRAKWGFLPALTWLSLVGLLASRARLRFIRQKPAYSMIEHCPALPFTTSGGILLFALPMPEKTHSRSPQRVAVATCQNPINHPQILAKSLFYYRRAHRYRRGARPLLQKAAGAARRRIGRYCLILK
jgi:hypothetical protein